MLAFGGTVGLQCIAPTVPHQIPGTAIAEITILAPYSRRVIEKAVEYAAYADTTR
jgi:hypothetical protein